MLIPNGLYNGQKLIKLVRANTMAITNNTIPKVPEMFSVKYNTAMTAATKSLMVLSAVPMFFFIIEVFISQDTKKAINMSIAFDDWDYNGCLKF